MFERRQRLGLERALNDNERNLLKPYFQPRTLDLVRIVEGHVPFWLHKSMCAVVLKHRIYLRTELDKTSFYDLASYKSGTHQTSFVASIELLAHELTHVEQYLSGMIIIKYLWASRHGYLKNPYEVEAYAKGVFVRKQIFSSDINKTVIQPIKAT